MCIIKVGRINAFLAPDMQLQVAKKNLRPLRNKKVNPTPMCKSNSTKPEEAEVIVFHDQNL